jgi:hypothetical protein
VIPFFFIFLLAPQICLASFENCDSGSGKWEYIYGENTETNGNTSLVSGYSGVKMCEAHVISGDIETFFNKSLFCYFGDIINIPSCSIDCSVGQITSCLASNAKRGVFSSCAVRRWVCTPPGGGGGLVESLLNLVLITTRN